MIPLHPLVRRCQDIEIFRWMKVDILMFPLVKVARCGGATFLLNCWWKFCKQWMTTFVFTFTRATLDSNSPNLPGTKIATTKQTIWLGLLSFIIQYKETGKSYKNLFAHVFLVGLVSVLHFPLLVCWRVFVFREVWKLGWTNSQLRGLLKSQR